MRRVTLGGSVEIKDFSYVETSHPFRIGNDVFHALPDVPFDMLAQITKLTNVEQTLRQHGAEMIIDIFTSFLQDESAALFKQRADEKAIGLKKVMEILPWLLEKFGLRPTQPSSNSSDGSSDGETGTSSTDGVLPEELTL
jgi:hypothetical protein